MIVRDACVLVPSEVAARVGPVLARALRAAVARGEDVDAGVVGFAEECNTLRRARADVADRVADVADPLAAARAGAHDALTVTQAAAEYGIPDRTLRSWCAKGRLGRRVGGRWEIRRDEIERLRRGDD